METFKIVIKGEKLTPDFFPIEKLTTLLNSLTKAIKTEVKKDNPDLNDNDILLSLSNIQKGSVSPVFYSPNQIVYFAYLKLVFALLKNIYEQLDIVTLKELKKITDLSKKNNITFYFYHKEKNTPPAVISQDTVISLPQKYILSGYTKLFGKLVSIGGINKVKAKIKLFDGRIIETNLSAELAKKLAKRLYEVVQIEGISDWDYDNWEVTNFQVKNILPFQDVPLKEAFRELGNAVNGHWKDTSIDVVKEVAAIRGLV